MGAAGAVAAGAAMARPPEAGVSPPQTQIQCRVVNGVRMCEEIICTIQNGVRVCTKIERRSEARDTEFWRTWERTQQLQQQREGMLKATREQAARWQQQYEAYRAAQERAWAEYHRVLAQTGSPQAAAVAYKTVMASAPPPPPQPTSFITGRARERPLPMAIMPEQPQQGQPQPQVPTWAAIGAGAAGLAAAAALIARRPAGLARIASRPVTEVAARRPTIMPFHTPLRPQPQQPRLVQLPRPQPPQPTTVRPSVVRAVTAGAAIGAGAAGLAAAAALLARRPGGLLKIASKPVTETVAKKPTVTPFHTPLRPQPQQLRLVQLPRPQPLQPTTVRSVAQAATAGAAQRAAMQASTRAARQVQAAAAARSITQAATRSANLGKLARFVKYGAGIGALGLIGYGLFAMAMTPETEAQQATQQAGAAGGAGAGAPRGAGAPGVGVGGAGSAGGAPAVSGADVGAGVGVGVQGPLCDALGRPIRMGMAPEVGYGAGVLGGEAGLDYGAVEGAGAVGVGEAGLDYGAVKEAGAVGGFGMPLMPLLILGGAALIIILALALSKKK